ncbi:MAG TPA: DUF3141 domain-containing protein [Nevskiaceae bacterium]|nr:DUF3141 domain-containing protein [Nevskiaceae bacterium]
MVEEVASAGKARTSSLFNPLAMPQAAVEYIVDAAQRSLLYADVMRQRGNQYREHLAEAVPNVLNFKAELVMSGLDLPRPVNYGLVRIVPPAGTVIDPGQRPFVVIDPRAGHGPGIGGFKPDSEVGEALKAGHPCYFIGFLPDPVPGQTVEDVMRAEAAFVKKVAELHPDSWGKPAVIGNCQAGWQILMTAAVWPELFGPIIVAGSPLSYWAGHNPMRHLGGLLGGSWLTALTSDLGAGRFDGAWLVQNFEALNPANTLWGKQYNLYSKIDTEASRYLEFEKFWGGHVFLSREEMQYTVDNLFVGNRLATAKLTTSDGIRIDLRNIRSPIVVFCSYGDNITPPPQALGWITDLYRNDEEVAAHNQTIVYATHDSIGHLGIFVSGGVARKEHREFTANIDIIDLLPAGIYRAEVKDRPAGIPAGELLDHEYLMSIRQSGVEEVRGIVQPDARSERRFTAAARVSEINLALYRNTWQPWLRAMTPSWAARGSQKLHPLRLGFEVWSDRNPLARRVAKVADKTRPHRVRIAPDNPFLQWQTGISDIVVKTLNTWRDARDKWAGQVFEMVYGSPLIQALAGQSRGDGTPARPYPGSSPEHRAYLQRELAALDASVQTGGLHEALVRALFYVIAARGAADGRDFRHIWQIVDEKFTDVTGDVDAFRRLVREQGLLVRRQTEAALKAIPQLLAGAPDTGIRTAIAAIDEIASRCDAPSSAECQHRDRVVGLFESVLEKRATATKPDRIEGSTPSVPPPRGPVRTARPRRRQGSPTPPTPNGHGDTPA